MGFINPIKTVYKKLQQSGFTLIELLVVITIIGIMSTLVVLSVKSTNKQDSMSAWLGQLDDKIDYALDAAVLSNKSFAIQFNSTQLQFLIRKNNAWVVYDKEPLKLTEFPKDTTANLYIGDAPAIKSEEFVGTEPDIIIDNLATMTPFELQIHEKEKTHIIKYNAVGEVVNDNRE